MANLNLLEKDRKRYLKVAHDHRYINFRKEADKDRLDHDAFIDKLNELINNEYQRIPVTTLRAKMPPKSFTLALRHSTMVTLAVFDGTKYEFYSSHIKNAKNKDTSSPMPMFKKQFLDRTGKTLVEAFGKTAQYFKVCVPQPIYYQSSLYPNYQKLKGVCKEDFSSHYPSCASQKLPDANTTKVVNEYVLPDEEYEFAFYPETGHIAIYNELDSHKYIKEQELYGADITNRKFKTDYHGRETKTVLMKAAKEKIVELAVYYDIKNKCLKGTPEYDHAKLFLNKFLGMFEQNDLKNYSRLPFAHLAAVIKWRANIKMFNLIKRIGEFNIIQIVVDGLLHFGPAVGTNEQKMGNLICEEENATVIQRGINQYIVFGKEITKCHAGLDVDIESDNIKDWKASEKIMFVKYINSIIEVEEI